MLRFCTLFDMRYATRALAMLESLEAHCRVPKAVTILALDDQVPLLLARLGRPEWRVLRVADLQDEELSALEQTRPRREFCWTCAPALSHHMVHTADTGDTVIYVDADLLFFADPANLLEELGEDGNILIHEHRYSPDRIQWESGSGRFNVGFVAFRVGDEARACTGRWRGQVLERCELDPEHGYCGDQGYLDEWPKRYPGLRILQNIGGGTAPWNVTAYEVGGSASQPTVDGVPVTFFHYHAFRTVAVPPFGIIAAYPAWGYDFTRNAIRILFRNYAKRIRTLNRRVARAGYSPTADVQLSPRVAFRRLRSGDCIPVI
ncbi:MAG TPA: hypothetical protein VKB51_11795 [bacterium]|nr:hypothetical protein [bacterium]